MRSQIQAERARKLSERFAIIIEPLDLDDDRETFRVEKPVRMRIRRSCHRCNASFAGNKVCPMCQHTRCKSCPRYPPPKFDKEKGKANELAFHGNYLEPDSYWHLDNDLITLTLPSRKPGGQPLVNKKPKQRVRRNCHECNTLFNPGNKICVTCGHIRCTDCPRDP